VNELMRPFMSGPPASVPFFNTDGGVIVKLLIAGMSTISAKGIIGLHPARLPSASGPNMREARRLDDG